MSIVFLLIAAIVVLVAGVWIFFGSIGGLGPDSTDFSLKRGIVTFAIVAPLSGVVAWAQASCALATSSRDSNALGGRAITAVWIAASFDMAVAALSVVSMFAGLPAIAAIAITVIFLAVSYATLAIAYPSLRVFR